MTTRILFSNALQCLAISLQEVTISHFRVCVKDDAGYDGQRSNVTVDYLVIGGK